MDVLLGKSLCGASTEHLLRNFWIVESSVERVADALARLGGCFFRSRFELNAARAALRFADKRQLGLSGARLGLFQAALVFAGLFRLRRDRACHVAQGTGDVGESGPIFLVAL